MANPEGARQQLGGFQAAETADPPGEEMDRFHQGPATGEVEFNKV